MKLLEEVINKGDNAIKGYINKIIDVLIPKEDIALHLPDLLNEHKPESLKRLLEINFIIKRYLIYITSNAESIIDTWAKIIARNNIYFNKKLSKISDEDLLKYVTGSKNKLKNLKNGRSFVDFDKSLSQNLIRGTLGKKYMLLKCISEENISWFLSNKKGNTNMSSSEEFFNFLETCRHLRNSITHNSLVVNKEFWIKIYEVAINPRINSNLDKKTTCQMVDEIFNEISTLLNKADFFNLKNKLINYIEREFKEDEIPFGILKKELNINFLLEK
ncbi:MAG: hypothetical protein TYPL_4490 [Candidatus Tyloplasma litorale]|nr:MAG: hypothetical protein TYPL_4490 [Mycoplasmatales bacterium]